MKVYEALNESQLSIKAGDVVAVSAWEDDMWYGQLVSEGQLQDEGWFPSRVVHCDETEVLQLSTLDHSLVFMLP